VDEAGVLPDPSETGTLSQVAFQDGTGIRVSAVRNRMMNFRLNEIHQGLQAGWKHKVIILTGGISRDSPAGFVPRFMVKGLWWGIRNAKNEDGPAFGQNLQWVSAPQP
jgi:hypothetical protein